VDERPHLQAPVRELAPEACPCYPEFPGEQPVQSQRARIGKLEDNLLAPRGLLAPGRTRRSTPTGTAASTRTPRRRSPRRSNAYIQAVARSLC
jgi:hypothetical protein